MKARKMATAPIAAPGKALAPSFILDDAREAGGEAEPVDVPAVMARIGEMCAAQRRAAQRLAEAEKAQKTAKADLFKIESEDMPELLREAGLTSVRLLDGTTVSLVDEIACGISEERAAAAHTWLREHGFGALIKNVVIASFGRGDEAKADALYLVLVKKLGVDAVERKETVHYQTLKAFIKERISAAADASAGEEDLAKRRALVPPFDLFGVHPFALAKIRLPKG